MTTNNNLMEYFNNPKVTIVIPTLNRLRFISETLSSVINQTYKNLEIIISDNGSKVDVKKHIEHFILNDNRISYRRNNITVPATEHFNQCINISNGKYFILISDDDYISNSFIETLVKKFEENSNLAVGLTTNIQIDENGFQISELPKANWSTKPGYMFLIDWLSDGKLSFIASFISVFTLTEIIKKTGGHPNFTDASHSDNAVAINLCLEGDVIFVEEEIFYYRVYKESFGLSLSHKSLAQASKNFIDFYNSFNFQNNNRFLNIKEIESIKLNIRKMAWKVYMGRLITVYNYSGVKLLKAILDYNFKYFEFKVLINQIFKKVIKNLTIK
jgi:glycosyltransferase involved in cell wall biosynthesis